MRKESLVATLDRLGVEKLARAQGLPPLLAARVAEVVTGTGLPDDKRDEVFLELVGHFQDGLAAGRSPAELVAAFGDARTAAVAIRQAKHVVTSESLGGTGPGDGFLRRLFRDARYAIRRLRAKPAFTAIAIASLGLGIGANTAMFTLVNDVILRHPAVERPEELVELYTTSKEFPFNVFSIPDYLDLVRGNTAFAGLAGSKFGMTPYQVDGTTQRLTTEMVSPNYFEVLGIKARAGRLLMSTDAPGPGQGSMVVLGERFWRRAFQSDLGVIGKSLKLAGGDFTIIGVVPADYPGRAPVLTTDIYAPLTMINQLEPSSADQYQDRSSQSVFIKGRLKATATLAQARVELERVAADLRAQQVGQWRLGAEMLLIPSSDVILFPPLDRVLRPLGAMLLLVVGLLLVVACANLAGFLLARAVDRRKEIAVRLALGATRAQLISQLLVETVMLSLAGGALGFWLGRTALKLVLASNLPFPLPVSLALAIDGRVLGFSLAVSVVAGLLFGLVPALQSTRLDLATIIRDEATGGGRKKWAARNILVGAQVAVSMVLMIIAGLFVRSLAVARQVDPGFGHEPAALVWVGIGPDEASIRLDRLRREIGALPGVLQVGAGQNIHLNTLGTMNSEVTVDGVEPPPGQSFFLIDRVEVDSGFVRAFGLSLTAGRNLTDRDSRDSLASVALVNEAFAAQFWPGQDPVGRRFRSTGGREIEVVGVVNTAKVRSLAEAPRPCIYLPLQQTDGFVWLVVKTAVDPVPVQAAVQRLVAAIPGAFVMQTRTLAEHIEVMSLPLKMGANALMGFAGLALVLACIGLYGAVSYAVSQRSREVGIRLSLGADRPSVIRLLMWGGLRVVLIGAAVGLVLAVLVGRLLEGMLFGVRAADPLTLIAVPVALIGVAGLAAYLPARRAGRIAPIAALRE